MHILAAIQQPIKNWLLEYGKKRTAQKKEFEALIDKNTVETCLESLGEVCGDGGFIMAIAIYPNSDGHNRATVVSHGMLSVDNCNLFGRALDELKFEEMILQMDTIAFPKILPSLPRNKEEYDDMVAGMVREATDGLPDDITDGAKALLKQAYTTGDTTVIDSVLDHINNRRNGQPSRG